ncbi:hypothetical protein B0H12DRAFT_1206341 [Mycena haematopus]|nr:hypothetical protein B0H12DRAFT_1206341 [Mycena haematopus]
MAFQSPTRQKTSAPSGAMLIKWPKSATNRPNKRRRQSLVPKWGLGRSLLALSPFLLLAPLIALKQHYSLPAPGNGFVRAQYCSGALLTPPDRKNALTNLPQISEARILGYAKYLSENIGYRTVGTFEHALADTWMVEQAEEAKRNCERVVSKETGRKLQCEVWRQQGSGTHRFDMMGKRLYKSYRVHLTNIIIRLSDGTDAGKEHALLLNSHLDSTLPSPGAADDAISVGIMLDCVRVLVETPGWSPAHAVVFSAGTTGRELLFQATSEEMVEAYSHVPRPFGTIFANDIFNSGFEEYLKVPGLDVNFPAVFFLGALTAGPHKYRTNMGENTLALIRHLTAPGSAIPKLAHFEHKRMRVVYFGLMSHFFMYRFSTAKAVYGTLLAGSLVLTRSVWKGQRRGVLAVMIGLLGRLLTPNIVALVMHRVLGKGMSWFAGGHFAAIGLYAPATLLGQGLASQLFVPTTDEQTVFSSILLLQAAAAFGIQLLNVGSAAMFFISGLPIFLAGKFRLWTYVLGQFLPLLTGTLITVPTVEVFVPLVSTITVWSDNIVATIVSVLGSQALPLALPFAHRFGRKSLRKVVIVLTAVTLMNMAFYARKPVFDEMHQKRLFVLHLENVTTHEHHLHIASADGAPGFFELVKAISTEFGSDLAVEEPIPLAMNAYNSDWDSLYPFSSFLSPYKIELPRDPGYISPWEAPDTSFTLSAVNDVTNLASGTRSFTLHVNHPGLIWTVIAFDAHVLKWNLDNNPPTEYARHYVKEASFYKADAWTLDLVKAMWPAKKAVKAEGGPAMKLFENLDGWLEDKTGGTVDALLLGCVAGDQGEVDDYVVGIEKLSDVAVGVREVGCRGALKIQQKDETEIPNNELELTQVPVSTDVPPARTDAGTFAAFRDQNQTEMNVVVRSMAYLYSDIG